MAVALDTSTSTNHIVQVTNGGWGWNSIKTYLSTLGNEPVQNLKIPVLMGVEVAHLTDTWGDARSGGRSHEGIDIMAPRGTPIVSPTKAVVASIGYGSNGGNYVYTINPGGERFYFAHLDSYAAGIASGKVLEPGDVIGYVGNSGNASGGAPHLHFGIYNGAASNPFPRLTLAFTEAERIAALNKMVEQAANPAEEAKTFASRYASFLKSAHTKGIAIGNLLLQELGIGIASASTPPVQASPAIAQSIFSVSFTRNLELGSKGEDVRALQKFLNANGSVVATTGAGSPGNETTYFGQATKAALVAYQKAQGIKPTSGYFGPITRSLVSAKASAQIAVAR